MRNIWLFALLALTMAGCATQPDKWADPVANLKTLFNDACLPVLVDGREVQAAAEEAGLEPADLTESPSEGYFARWKSREGFGRINFMADRGCYVFVGFGSPGEAQSHAASMNQDVLRSLTSRGIDMGLGLPNDEPRSRLIGTMYCSVGIPRYWLTISHSDPAFGTTSRVTIMLRKLQIGDGYPCDKDELGAARLLRTNSVFEGGGRASEALANKRETES